MSYDQRSQIRQICIKFLRFSFLIDFLALDSLSTIYMNSVIDLRNKLQSLTEIEEEKILTDAEKGKTAFGGKLPMFKVNVNFCETSPNEDEEIKQVKLPFFEMPEGDSMDPVLFKDYNIIGHPFVIDFSGIKENEIIQKRQMEEFDDSRKFVQKKVVNIEKMWLNLNPNNSRFIGEIQKVFTDGMNSLLSFERWSKHPETLPYSAILEEWDDQIGKDNEGLDSHFLNPEHWVNDTFRTNNLDEIRQFLNKAFDKATNYLKQFREFLQIFWEYKNIDYNLLLHEDLAKPRITMKSILMVLDYHKSLFETSIPFQADIGLLRISSTTLKENMKPMPEEVKDKLKEMIPKELSARCKQLDTWIKN